MTSVLEVKGLVIERSGTRIIDEASFTIEKGDFAGIVGPNGSGKSTLLKGILGIEPKKSGEVFLFGTELSKFKDWGRVGYVSQSAINFDDKFPLTVRELVGLGQVSRSNLGKRLSAEDWKKVDETMEYMGIIELGQKRIGQLSGGEKQKVFVAKALVRDPELIILDEPVAGVDIGAIEKFYRKLSELVREKGTTVLVVSHDLSVVFCQMSKILCVNRDVYSSEITPDLNETELLRKVYGDHFTFVFHKHECWSDLHE
ncbi:MAG: metal ABC transporter ATP-binding protein [Thermoplasmata archaeon]|nr:metal ABC transporter ATP-binding protein [Thermoplasmata archaeon]